MSDIVSNMQRSAELVKVWGQLSMPDGQTLAQAFTFKGLPLWSIFSPELAVWHVPRALSRGERSISAWQRVRPYLSRVKHSALSLATRRQLDMQGCAQWPAGPTCLFLGFSPYMYRDVLAPVVSRLKEQQISCVSLFDRELLAPQCGQIIHSVRQHKTSQVVNDICLQRRELSAWTARWLAPHMLPRIIRDGTRPLWPQIGDLFRVFFWVYLPRIVEQAVIARHILEKHHPSLIVSADVADARCRLYVLLGREYGIPSLKVQFGFIGPLSVEWQFFTADHLTVRSQKWYDKLLGHGVPAEKMTITGSPIYDDLTGESKDTVALIRRRLNIPAGHKIALFASSWSHSKDEEWADDVLLNRAKQSVFEAASRVPGLTLVVKPHPRENAAETRKLARGFDNIIFVKSQDDIRDLVKACDVFISFGSITNQIALVVGKPVIHLMFPEIYWMPVGMDIYVQSGVVIKVRSVDEMVRRLQDVVDGSIVKALNELEPARQRFLKEWMHQPDGRAGARIAELAKQMAGIFC
jgi:hypothetical protein